MLSQVRINRDKNSCLLASPTPKQADAGDRCAIQLNSVSCVALLLADIIFNRARVTTKIIKLVLDAVGSAIPVVPC
jgi:hypothetical protein